MWTYVYLYVCMLVRRYAHVFTHVCMRFEQIRIKGGCFWEMRRRGSWSMWLSRREWATLTLDPDSRHAHWRTRAYARAFSLCSRRQSQTPPNPDEVAVCSGSNLRSTISPLATRNGSGMLLNRNGRTRNNETGSTDYRMSTKWAEWITDVRILDKIKLP